VILIITAEKKSKSSYSSEATKKDLEFGIKTEFFSVSETRPKNEKSNIKYLIKYMELEGSGK